MSKASQRHKRRTKAKELLKDVGENPSDYLIIHYSCESFFNLPQGNTPRITSIAVRYVRNAQTHSFSIHKIAELKGITPNNINQHFNTLEKEMLDEYFDFVRNHPAHKWIHINMRNVNFGFEAINHRYRVLGGIPTQINDNLKVDLARIFVDTYGRQYSAHPRFESLYNLNKITMTSFLNGGQEADAFNNGDYVALHQSTLRKVDNMHNVLSLAIENDLKTKSNIFQIYGITPSGIFYSAKENWIVAVVLFLVGVIVATLLTIGINRGVEYYDKMGVKNPTDSKKNEIENKK